MRFTANDPPALAAFSGQAVKITVEIATTGGDVLTVPVSAVVTSADGRARVHVEVPGGQRDVYVKLGLTAMGAVQVTPEGGELGTFCVYEADSPEAIRAHAATSDLPVDEVVPIADTVIVRPDPAPVAG